MGKKSYSARHSGGSADSATELRIAQLEAEVESNEEYISELEEKNQALAKRITGYIGTIEAQTTEIKELKDKVEAFERRDKALDDGELWKVISEKTWIPRLMNDLRIPTSKRHEINSLTDMDKYILASSNPAALYAMLPEGVRAIGGPGCLQIAVVDMAKSDRHVAAHHLMPKRSVSAIKRMRNYCREKMTGVPSPTMTYINTTTDSPLLQSSIRLKRDEDARKKPNRYNKLKAKLEKTRERMKKVIEGSATPQDATSPSSHASNSVETRPSLHSSRGVSQDRVASYASIANSSLNAPSSSPAPCSPVPFPDLSTPQYQVTRQGDQASTSGVASVGGRPIGETSSHGGFQGCSSAQTQRTCQSDSSRARANGTLAGGRPIGETSSSRGGLFLGLAITPKSQMTHQSDLLSASTSGKLARHQRTSGGTNRQGPPTTPQTQRNSSNTSREITSAGSRRSSGGTNSQQGPPRTPQTRSSTPRDGNSTRRQSRGTKQAWKSKWL